jgi:hypothetical protein
VPDEVGTRRSQKLRNGLLAGANFCQKLDCSFVINAGVGNSPVNIEGEVVPDQSSDQLRNQRRDEQPKKGGVVLFRCLSGQQR